MQPAQPPEGFAHISEFIRSLKTNDPDGKKKLDFAAEVADLILKLTGHVPIVTNIAQGAGYCSYYARMSEAIGVRAMKDYNVDRVAGKGSNVHKILGLASLRLFSGRWWELNVGEIIQESAEFLRNEDLMYYESTDDEPLAHELILNLVTELPAILQKLEIAKEKIFPLVEQHFIDYGLHMRGTPDLILEDKDERKALVVDWKTNTAPPTNYENCQVLCYALFEAKRLSYDGNLGNAVLGTLIKDQGHARVDDVRVLPIIVRRRMKRGRHIAGPHPLLYDEQEVEEKYQGCRNLLNRVRIEAEHLTILETDQRDITSIDRQSTTLPIYIRNNLRNLNVLRYTPNTLPRGRPAEQNAFPCRSKNGRWTCNLSQACRHYFGDFEETKKFEELMWSLRFKTFRKMERSLLTYRAIYELFCHYVEKEIISQLIEGLSWSCKIGQIPDRDRERKGMHIIAKRNELEIPSRVDVLERVELDVGGQRIKGIRKLREIEKSKNIYYVIGEGKPVLLCTNDCGMPLLSINAFGRVDEVEVNKEGGETNLVYYIGVPSKLMKYQMAIFKEYMQGFPAIFSHTFMFEVNADLTQMELNAIDALERELGKNEELDTEPLKASLAEMKEELQKESDEGTVEEAFKRILEQIRSNPVKSSGLQN